jgi:hypothetical protein
MLGGSYKLFQGRGFFFLWRDYFTWCISYESAKEGRGLDELHHAVSSIFGHLP